MILNSLRWTPWLDSCNYNINEQSEWPKEDFFKERKLNELDGLGIKSLEWNDKTVRMTLNDGSKSPIWGSNTLSRSSVNLIPKNLGFIRMYDSKYCDPGLAFLTPSKELISQIGPSYKTYTDYKINENEQIVGLQVKTRKYRAKYFVTSFRFQIIQNAF